MECQAHKEKIDQIRGEASCEEGLAVDASRHGEVGNLKAKLAL